MAWTGKASLIGFKGAAEMGAGQAQCGESAISVDKKRRDIGNGCTRAERILIHGAKVKFRFTGGFRFVGKKTNQAAKRKGAAEVENSIAGKFEKITAGEVGHLIFPRHGIR